MSDGALLAILTVGPACEVCVLPGGAHPPIEASQPGLTGQDAILPDLAQHCLDQGKLHFSDLTRIGVCVGPGSFTGLRIGVAYARGLALALGVPCLGITSTLAATDPVQLNGSVRVALEAKRRPPDQTVWTQLIDVDGPIGAVEEWPLGALGKTNDAMIGDVSGAIPSTPSANNVAAWARRLDPTDYPPTPAYVRAPDAKLPGGVDP